MSVVLSDAFSSVVVVRAGGAAALVNPSARGDEPRRPLLYALLKRGPFVELLLRGVVANVLRYLHRAEVRAAHRAEVRELRALLRQGLVVVLARDLLV